MKTSSLLINSQFLQIFYNKNCISWMQYSVNTLFYINKFCKIYVFYIFLWLMGRVWNSTSIYTFFCFLLILFLFTEWVLTIILILIFLSLFNFQNVKLAWIIFWILVCPNNDNVIYLYIGMKYFSNFLHGLKYILTCIS